MVFDSESGGCLQDSLLEVIFFEFELDEYSVHELLVHSFLFFLEFISMLFDFLFILVKLCFELWIGEL